MADPSASSLPGSFEAKESLLSNFDSFSEEDGQGGEDATIIQTDHSSTSSCGRRYTIRQLICCCVLFSLLSVAASLLVFTTWYSKPSSSDQGARNPHDFPIEYENRVFEKPGIYSGEPNERQDAAWKDLLRYTYFHVPETDTQNFKADEDIVLPDGSGYFTTFAAYHELHCIKHLHWWLHRDYFHPNQTKAEANRTISHLDHCLNMLSQSAQCHGDTSLLPFHWKPDDIKPESVPDRNEHRCVKWDPLNRWAAERAVDLRDPRVLTHPTFGPLYRDGHFVKIEEITGPR